jgi:hypothetical protein
MDIQNLIKLAHQADLEGNYRVADKLTQRAIREAIFGFGRRGRGTSGGGGIGGGFFGGGGKDFSMHSNTAGGHSGGGAGGPAGPINTGGGNTGGGGAGGRGGRGGNAKNKGGGGAGDTPGVAELRRRRDRPNPGDTPLTPEEHAQIEAADRRNEADRNRRNKQKAEAGPGGGGGGGGRGGDLNSGGQSVDTRGGSSSADGGDNIQNQNARYKTRDVGGDVIGMGTMGSLGLATVPTAIVAALGAYGYTMLNGRVVDQKTGQPVPPQNLPPQVKNLMSGGAKANQLALRTQANQMGNAQAAQSFIEDRRANPAFKTAQDFYNDAKNKGYNQSMINQITALAKAEGYPDLSPYSN